MSAIADPILAEVVSASLSGVVQEMQNFLERDPREVGAAEFGGCLQGVTSAP